MGVEENILLAIHLLSVAIGAGSGYIIVILHQVERAKPGTTSIYGAYKPLSWLLRGGLATLIISGWLLVDEWSAAFQNTIFLWKLFFVAVLVVNSIIVGGVLSPKFREAFQVKNKDEREAKVKQLEQWSLALGFIQAASWTLVIIFSAFTHIK